MNPNQNLSKKIIKQSHRILRDLIVLFMGGILALACFVLLVWQPDRVTASGLETMKGAEQNPPSLESPDEYSGTEHLRKYYVTNVYKNGAQPDDVGVCRDGFHMASMWELLDTTNLQYYKNEDSTFVEGYGPPNHVRGWVHTGYISNSSSTIGNANCSNWSLDGGGVYGTAVSLADYFSEFFDLHFWNTYVQNCGTSAYVWCVQDADDVNPPMRQFYLTEESTYNGGEADGNDDYGSGVCSNGYHLASMWEIVDTSRLQYNVNNGATRGDSGMGPPSGLQGWIGTGNENSGGDTTGSDCYRWDSSATDIYGTVVNLPTDWTDVAQKDLHIWNAETRQCSTDQRVWCVADEVNGPGSCAVPLTISCGQRIYGHTEAGTSHMRHYECQAGWDETGPEHVYALTLPEGWTYDITASIDILDPGGGAPDLDIFFLTKEDCNTGAALNQAACGNDSLTQTSLSGDTYYIVVDGYNGASGGYFLEVDCTPTLVYLPFVTR